MASLEELRRRLYKEKESFPERTAPPDMFEPHKKSSYQFVPPESSAQTNIKVNKIPSLNFNSKFLWGGVALILIAGVAAIFLFIESGSIFKLQAPTVQIQGSTEIKSGDKVSWQVQITNTSQKAVENAVLVFNFPSDAVPVSGLKPPGVFRERRNIGTVLAGQSVSESFNAYIFGGRGSRKKVNATLEYRPEGVSAVLAKEASFDFTIIQSPVAVSFKMPDALRLGQETKFEIHYTSQSDASLKDLVLELIFPQGFEFISSNLRTESMDFAPNKNSRVWSLRELAPHKEGVITVRGTIKGNDAESKNFSAKIGVLDTISHNNFLSYDEVAHVVTLRSPFLEVSMKSGGEENRIVSLGDTVSVNIDWKNNLPDEIKSGILEVTIDGSGFDLSTLHADKGVYSESKKSIIWNQSTYTNFKNIKSGDKGNLSFSFRIKNNLTLDFGASHPSIKLIATFKPVNSVPGFEGFDVSGSGELDIKITSRLQFSSKALYFNSPIFNTGSLPPVVGKETTYTVIWSLANTTNDVDSVLVRSSLPPYMEYKNSVSPADTNVSFDQNTGVLEWKVGRVLAGTGFLRPAIQISFQLGLVPSASQVGSSPVIVNEAEAAGRDTFTDSAISSTGSAITIELPDDPSLDSIQKKVAK